MKSLVKSLFIPLLLLTTLAIKAQTPDAFYGFETADDDEGWGKFSATTQTVSGGVNYISDIGNFGGIRTGDGLNIADGTYTHVTIVMRNNTEFADWQILSYETGSTSGGTAGRENFTASVNDTDFQKYTVVLPASPAANSGIIDRLGLRAGGDPVSTDGIEIESITLESANFDLEWDFNYDNDAQGWIEGNATATVSSGAMTLDFDGTNTPKITFSGLSFDATAFPEIEFKIKNNTAVDNVSAANNAVSMRVKTVSASAGNKFLPFDHTASDTEFQTYLINLSGGNYDGTITEIEIQAIRDSNPGSIEIDNIRLVSAISNYTLTTAASGFGTVDLLTGEYPEGETTITATPTFGNEFVNWTDGSGAEVSTDAAYTFTLDADLSLTANFQATSATTIGWYFDTDEEGWSTVGGAAVSAIQADGALTFSIDATSGNPRIEVTGLAVSAANFPYARLTAKNNTSVSAPGDLGGVGMRFRSDNAEGGLGLYEFTHSSSDEDFKTYIIDLSTDVDYGGIIQKFEFQGIRDGITIGTIDIDKIELIGGPDTYTVTTSATGLGEVDLPTGDYTEGYTLITASAFVGNEFTGWSGDVVSTDNPLALNLNENLALSANFDPISGEEIVWNFDTDDDTEGWGSNANADITVAGGILTMTITGNTPKLERFDVGLNPYDYAAMEIRLKNNTSVGPIDDVNNTHMRVGYDPFNEVEDLTDKFYNIDGSANDGDFVVYSIPLGEQANYVNADYIEALQFVGPRQQGAGTVEIDYIKFIPKQEQTMTFGALDPATFGDSPITLTGSTDADGLSVFYTSSNLDVATIDGNELTIVGAGDATITAIQNGDSYYYGAVPIEQSFSVEQASQTIQFNALDPVTFGDADFDLSATTDANGLEVSFSSEDTDVIMIDGGTVTIVGAGTATIIASQAGNTNYSAALPVEQILTVNKADQTISITELPDLWGTQTTPFTVVASVDSELDLSYSVTGPATNSDSEVTINGTSGTITITVSSVGTTNYNAAENSVTFEVVSCDDVEVTTSSNNVTCFGDGDGDVDLTVNGGIGEYSVSWSNSAETEDLSNLEPGTYTVTISFGEFCSKQAEVTITSPDEIILTGTTTESNGADGAIDITVFGGSGSFTYDWDNSASSEDLTGLAPGDYTVVVTDSQTGCEVTETFTVESGITLSTDDLRTAVKVYPNPTANYVIIGTNSDWLGAEAYLLDLSGKVVGSEKLINVNQEISLSHLPKGRYFLKINSKEKSEIISIVKN